MNLADWGIGPKIAIQGYKGVAEFLYMDGNVATVYVENRTKILRVSPSIITLLSQPSERGMALHNPARTTH